MLKTLAPVSASNVAQLFLELRKGDHSPGLGMGHQRLDLFQVDHRVELFGQEREDRGDRSQVHRSPKSEQEPLRVLQDQDDQVVFLYADALQGQGVGRGFGIETSG